MEKKPKILVCTPEIILGLDAGMGNLLSGGINFSTGGMAPVNSTYILGLIKDGTFDVYAAIPKWESSLRELNDLTTQEIKLIDSALPNNFFLINHPSFNKVHIEGSNTKMYDDSWRFSIIDRALAFSSGIVNTVMPKVRPDIIWLNDWMLGPVAPVAKAMGIKVVTTGHNIFTKTTSFDEVISKGIELREFDNYQPNKWIYWSNGKFDFMASEINAADDFTTVSKGFLERLLYSEEIYNKSPSVVQSIRNKAWYHNSEGKKIQITHPDGRPRVHGYPNPLEKEHSDFLTSIDNNGLEETIIKRKNNAKELRMRTGLKEGGDLLIFPNRLYKEQKNPELLIDNAINLAKKYNLRILILANGEQNITEKARSVALNSNGLVSYFSFDKNLEELAKESDNTYCVMTPDYEPCGGPNINYPSEGTLIIGHHIDGIKDTVKLLNMSKSEGNGFPYNNNNLQGLEWGISEMKKFSGLPDNIRYAEYIRIAKKNIADNSASARTYQLVKEIFLPLYFEKYQNKTA